jgi:hypothetical protein
MSTDAADEWKETPIEPAPVEDADAALKGEKRDPSKPDPDAVFRCPKCRTALFRGSDVIPHEATKTRKFSKKRQQFGSKENGCMSFFIEKPEWLDATGRMSDTIFCPNCRIKIGHFSWIGQQCSCGEWVKPSFQIPISRVDAV